MQKQKGYRGNKGVLGLYQFIINRIPQCNTIVELFAGSGAITEKILSTAVTDENNCWHLGNGSLVRTILNDCNPGTTDILKKKFQYPTKIYTLNALQFLSSVMPGLTDVFIYADPPYQLSTRGSQRRIYEYEMSDSDHVQLLQAAVTVNCNWMISHYKCDLYDSMLPGWTKEKFKVSYHGKVKEECIYYNYEKPSKLLTYQYVGSDCWDRQRVTRKINRLSEKLLNLPALERNAIIDRVINRLT
jgi:DNA adenine methylase